MSRRSSNTALALASAVLLAAALITSLPQVASASGEVGPAVDLGDVGIVKSDDPDSLVRSGKAATEFRVLLPAGATCPGDSATGQWRIQTFMVPDGADVGSLTYAGAGPTGENQFPLYTGDAAQRSWTNKVLPANTGTDPATPVPALPIFSFAAVSVVKVAEGPYRIGVACTLFGATAQYWDARIEVSGSALGNQSAFRWSVLDLAPPPPSSGPSPWLIAAVALFGLLVAAAIVVALMRARTSSQKALSRKEHQ